MSEKADLTDQETEVAVESEPNAEDAPEGLDPVAESPAETAREDEQGAELEALRQQLLRVHADFDNFRKRTRQEKDDLQKFATKQLLADLLPIADNFERALQSLDVADAGEQLRTGVEMVQRQLMQVLQRYGVEPIAAENQRFDPTLHEAVMQEPADGREAGIVAQVLQTGYTLHGKVLRPAMVKVTV